MNVKTLRIVYSHSFKITTIAMMVFMAGQAFPPHSYCQIRSGAAFLKIMPGVRNQGLAGSVTAAIDEAHSLYANPAATAYLREHQWALSYTKWMADIYNLSFIYGRQMRTPLHRRMRLALGLNYQGVKEFDSTVKLQAPASAGDLLAVASIGFPLSFISDHIAVGSNAKYLRSQLDDFTTATYIVDAGILIRTRRSSQQALQIWHLLCRT